jgi:hypothetical protein
VQYLILGYFLQFLEGAAFAHSQHHGQAFHLFLNLLELGFELLTVLYFILEFSKVITDPRIEV